MNTETTEQTTPAPEVAATLAPEIADRLHALTSQITIREQSAKQEIASVKRATLDDLVGTYGTMGEILAGLTMVLFASPTADQIAQGFRTQGSGIYVDSAAVRETLPNKRAIDLALTVHRYHTVERLARFRQHGNTEALREYSMWLKIDAGIPLGNKSNIDLAKSRQDGKAAKITRTPGESKTSEPTVSAHEWGKIGTMSDADIDAQILSRPVVDLSTMSIDQIRAIAMQATAMVVKYEREHAAPAAPADPAQLTLV